MFTRIFNNIIGKKKALRAGELKLTRSDLEFAEGMRRKMHSVFGRSARIRQVDAGSCNACEWECTAMGNPVYDSQRFGVDFVASPRHADIILVTGPVSLGMVLALKKTYLATPGPKLVIACGDCSKDGGIYRGSYAVTDGAAEIVPVDSYIPGCPPTPRDILAGISRTIDAFIK